MVFIILRIMARNIYRVDTLHASLRDLHCLGKDAYCFYTEPKTVTTHWFDEEEKKTIEVST